SRSRTTSRKDQSDPSRCNNAPPADPGAPSKDSPTSPSSTPTSTPPPNGDEINSTSYTSSSPPAPGYHQPSPQLNSYQATWTTVARWSRQSYCLRPSTCGWLTK